MEIRAKDAETLFAAAYGIGSEHRVAFRRRLEHLRTYGCPVGLDTGRGRPALYGWLQLIQQTLALDLLDAGLPPERAARVAAGTPNRAGSHAAFLIQMSDWANDASRWADSDEWPLEHTLILFVRLNEISRIGSAATALSDDPHPIAGRDFSEWFQNRGATETVGIFIDFGLMISALIKRVSMWTQLSTGQVATSFYDWAEARDVHP